MPTGRFSVFAPKPSATTDAISVQGVTLCAAGAVEPSWALVDCYDFVILKPRKTKGERGPSRRAQRSRHRGEHLDGRVGSREPRQPLVVPFVPRAVRGGALGAVLQLGRSDLGWRALLLLVSAPLDPDRRCPERGRLLRDGPLGRLGRNAAPKIDRTLTGREIPWKASIGPRWSFSS